MKKILVKVGFQCVASAMLLASVWSCSEDNSPSVSDSGRIALGVGIDVRVITSRGRSADGLDVTAADLSVSLTSADGSFSQTWPSAEQFPVDRDFKAGRYVLSAFYGDSKSEGFEKPYYFGQTDVTVIADQTTPAKLTATLAKAMVSIDYTEAFISYMADYSAEIQGKQIFFAKNETRPAYVVPGTVVLNISVTKPNGKSATLNAANFTAIARHHYHITVDVNGGEVGDAVLSIIFDDMLDEETVSIDLSDELFDAPAPEFTAVGFSLGDVFELVEGSSSANMVQLNLIARGGLRSVNLIANSASLNQRGWPSTLDLISATDAQRAALTQLGFSCLGLWKSPDQMAVIDFSDVLSHIKYVEGSDNISSFSLNAVDKMTKTGEEISFSVKVLPVILNLLCPTAPKIGENKLTLDVEYNGADLAGMVVFEYRNERGSWTSLPIQEVQKEAGGHYTVVLVTPDDVSDLTVRAVYATGCTSDELSVVRVVPEFTLSVDASDVFAHTAAVSVACAEKDAAYIASIIDYQVSTDGGNNYYDIDAKVEGATVSFSGLVAGTTYTLRGVIGARVSSAVNFATEDAAQFPNSNMESWYSVDAYTKKSLWIGETDIKCWYPNSGNESFWATRNPRTTAQNSGTTCHYTSYSSTLPVDHDGGKAAEIATLGYGEGTTYTHTSSGQTGSPTPKYVCAGMLFVGDYSCPAVEQETVSFGKPFASRPSAVRFAYKYSPVNGESFRVHIVLENRSGSGVTEIARGELVSGESMTDFSEATINLEYTDRKLKCTHAYIVFESSTSATPSAPSKQGSKGAFNGYGDSKYQGSTLTVDDIELIY